MSLKPMITGSRYMISTGQYLATQAGHAILEEGGNAIDAGVAAGIALGVSDQVQFSGVAPSAHLSCRAEQGGVDRGTRLVAEGCHSRPVYSRIWWGDTPGLARTVIPAAPGAWILALETMGTMSFSQIEKAAIRYARDGFAMHSCMAAFVDQFADSYQLFPSSADSFLPGGEPIKTGQLFALTRFRQDASRQATLPDSHAEVTT